MFIQFFTVPSQQSTCLSVPEQNLPSELIPDQSSGSGSTGPCFMELLSSLLDPLNETGSVQLSGEVTDDNSANPPGLTEINTREAIVAASTMDDQKDMPVYALPAALPTALSTIANQDNPVDSEYSAVKAAGVLPRQFSFSQAVHEQPARPETWQRSEILTLPTTAMNVENSPSRSSQDNFPEVTAAITRHNSVGPGAVVRENMTEGSVEIALSSPDTRGLPEGQSRPVTEARINHALLLSSYQNVFQALEVKGGNTRQLRIFAATPTLGEVDVKMTQADQALSVNFEANPVTTEWLGAQSDQLRAAIFESWQQLSRDSQAEAGFSKSELTLSFSSNGEQAPSQGRAGYHKTGWTDDRRPLLSPAKYLSFIPSSAVSQKSLHIDVRV